MVVKPAASPVLIETLPSAAARPNCTACVVEIAISPPARMLLPAGAAPPPMLVSSLSPSMVTSPIELSVAMVTSPPAVRRIMALVGALELLLV